MHDLGGNEITEAITTGSSEPFTPNKYGTEEVERLTVENARLRSELAAYKSAEAAGLMPRLPDIPYNKTLYWIWGDEIMPVRYRGIRGGCVGADKKYHVTCNMTTKKDRTFYYRGRPRHICKAGDKRMFYADDLGKNIFRTRKAAAAALKGGD